MKIEKNEIKSTAHSKCRCQYHIVFAPKYRRKEIYGTIKKDIGEILRKLCEQKGVEIIEAEACPDHIHMLVSIPPHISIAQFMGYLKGKRSLMIFDRHANLKYKLSRILRRYGREKQKGDCRLYKNAAGRRLRVRSNQHQRVHRPVYG